jgi:hypothetical protein
MRLFHFILVLCLTCPALAAHSKKKKALKPVAHAEETYLIPFAQTEMKIIEPVVQKKRTREIEISASTWTPKNFSRRSYLADTTDFERSSLPNVSLNFLNQIYVPNEKEDISAKIGLSYLSLERFANIGLSASRAHEVANVFSLRLGAEYANHLILPKGFEPAIGIYFLPTWIIGAINPIDSGVNATGLPIEASLDLLYRLQTTDSLLGTSSFVFGLGVHQIYGQVDEAELTGLGIQGIFRLTL